MGGMQTLLCIWWQEKNSNDSIFINNPWDHESARFICSKQWQRNQVLTAHTLVQSFTTGALWVSGKTKHSPSPPPSLWCTLPPHPIPLVWLLWSCMSSIAILESWSCSLRELHSKFHLHLLWPSPRKETHTKVGIFPVLFFSFKDQNWNVTRKHKNLF